MKKLFAVSLVAVSLACLAPQAGAVTVGIKGGLNLAEMTVKSTAVDLPDFKSRKGMVEGIFVNFKLGPVSIQPELLYSSRGLSYIEVEDETTRVTGLFYLDYVEVPVLVKYSFLSGKARPFLYAGPSFSVLLKAQQGYDVDFFDDIEPDYNYRLDMEENIKKSEFAGVFGAGVDIKLPKVMLSLEGRYHFGLTNIGTDALLAEADITSAKNKGFSILVGIGF